MAINRAVGEMIYITLRTIKERRPCKEGWDKILEARGGEDAYWDEAGVAAYLG